MNWIIKLRARLTLQLLLLKYSGKQNYVIENKFTIYGHNSTSAFVYHTCKNIVKFITTQLQSISFIQSNVASSQWSHTQQEQVSDLPWSDCNDDPSPYLSCLSERLPLFYNAATHHWQHLTQTSGQPETLDEFYTNQKYRNFYATSEQCIKWSHNVE